MPKIRLPKRGDCPVCDMRVALLDGDLASLHWVIQPGPAETSQKCEGVKLPALNVFDPNFVESKGRKSA